MIRITTEGFQPLTIFAKKPIFDVWRGLNTFRILAHLENCQLSMMVFFKCFTES